MQLWMCSVTESQYLLNLYIESNRCRMILITSKLALGLISAETLGVPRAKTDRRDAQDLQYAHTSVSHIQIASSESWYHSRTEKCDWQNLRRKLWETAGSGEQQPLLTSQPNCVVSACTQLKYYVMTTDTKCRCIAYSATERHTATTIIWTLRHGFGCRCTISHIKCGHPGAEDTDYFCVYTNYKSLILRTKPTVGITGYKSKNHGFIKSATNSDYCTSIKQPCAPLQWRNPQHKTEKGRPRVLQKHSPS
jgi:hypothetical protein